MPCRIGSPVSVGLAREVNGTSRESCECVNIVRILMNAGNRCSIAVALVLVERHGSLDIFFLGVVQEEGKKWPRAGAEVEKTLKGAR